LTKVAQISGWIKKQNFYRKAENAEYVFALEFSCLFFDFFGHWFFDD
jgi:hypothetical protein